MSGRRPRAEPKQREGKPRQLYPLEVFKPLNPDKPLAPTRVPPLKAFDQNMPGHLALDDMGMIELPDEDLGTENPG